MIFWKCVTTSNTNFNKKLAYLSDPSLDPIEHFKERIVTYDVPTNREDYVQCDHIEKSKNYLLFILGSRVEVLIKPDYTSKELYFMDCNDL